MAGKQAFKTILKNATVALGQLISVNGPSMKIDFTEVTHHGQTDPWREFLPTLAEGGEFEFKLLMDSANQIVLEALFDPTLAASAWSITTSHSTPIVITMSGWLAEYPIIDSAEVDGVYEVTCKVKTTGKITIA